MTQLSEAIRRSGNFRVWSLSFKDVQSVFAPQGDFYTTTLEAEKMPSGKTMYQNMIKKQKADVIEPAKLSSFDLLLEYLKLPDAEIVFKGTSIRIFSVLVGTCFDEEQSCFQ